MEWKYTKSYIKNFRNDLFWTMGGVGSVILAIIAIQQGGAVIDHYCSVSAPSFLGLHLQGIYCPFIVPIGLIFFATSTIMLVWFLSSILIDVLIQVSKWARTPQHKNIHLYSGSCHADTFTLKFLSTEWRYLFNKIEVSVDIPASYFGLSLKWKECNTRTQIIKRLKSYEFEFLRANSSDDYFEVLNKSYVHHFGIGIHKFQVHTLSTINLKREKKNIDSLFDVVVDYRGGNNFLINVMENTRYVK